MFLLRFLLLIKSPKQSLGDLLFLLRFLLLFLFLLLLFLFFFLKILKNWKMFYWSPFSKWPHHNTAKIQHCPISSKFDMWVDNDVPYWFPTLKNFYRSPFTKWPPQYPKNSTLSDIIKIWYVGRYKGSNTGKRARRKISIGLQLGKASLETRNLSLGCLRFFRLALLPVFDSFSH